MGTAPCNAQCRGAYTVRYVTLPYIKLASTVTRGHSPATDAMKLSKIKTICLAISRTDMDPYKKKIICLSLGDRLVQLT